MRTVSSSLFKLMTRVDGLRFMGFVTTPMGSKEEDMYHRVLYVKKPSPVGLGDIVIGAGWQKLLLMEYPEDQEWRANFRAAFVNQELTWERMTKYIDPVAQVARDFQLTPMGTIHTYLDKPLNTKIGSMNDTKYSFYTGAAVIEGDIVGGKIVKKIIQSMGVKLVHVE